MLTIQSTVEDVMLQQPDRRWELHRGELREKPSMTESHNRLIWRLSDQLAAGLDRSRYELRVNLSRLTRDDRTYYIPDVAIVPGKLTIRNQPPGLEVFRDPLPFVAEVWSPSTGNYDVDQKLPEYQARGDLEIWRVHPFDYTVSAWCLEANGTYHETIHDHGRLALHALPGIMIDLDELFR